MTDTTTTSEQTEMAQCWCCEAEATTEEPDSGDPACEDCTAYAVDEDGEARCACGDDVEAVTESCGAGGQTRTYYRVRPPAMPPEDPQGEWACYWATVGDDAHVVSRHATEAEAEQAVMAHDWPPPGDHTRYQCGYEVRYVGRPN